MASPLEQVSADLKVARLVVHKLGETFNSFQVHSHSIFTLADQWRNLQSSFAHIYKSLEIRVQELESKDRDIGTLKNKLLNFEKEVELKRKKLQFGEESLSDKIKEVELRQNDVKKWLEVIEVKKREIIERKKAVEVKEKELVEGLERVKKVDDDEIRVKKFESEVDEWRKVVELEESRVKKVAEKLESREKLTDGRCKAVESRESRVDERYKELELREREIKENKEVLEAKGMRLNEENRAMEANKKRLMEDQQTLELRERDMDDLYSLLETRENEINESFKEVESKKKELKLREEDMNLQHEELISNKRDIIERLDVLEVKEKESRDGCRALEEKHNEINERFACLVVREEEINKRSHDLEHKEMQVDAQCMVLEAREGVLNDQLEILELRVKEVDERCKAVELRENEVDERCKELNLRERTIKEHKDLLEVKETMLNKENLVMQANEKRLMKDQQALELRERQTDELYNLLELRENEISGRFNGMESKGKELKDGCRVLEEKENKINESFASLMVREEEVNKQIHDVELKETQVNAQCIVVEAKEGMLNDQWEMLELKGKEVDERCKAMDLKEKEVGELHQGVKLKEKQMNECLQGLQLQQKQIHERFKEMGVNEKEISERYKEIEIKEKQITRRKKAQELREKKFEDASKVLQLKEKEVLECYQMLEKKEKRLNELPQALELKEEQCKVLSKVEQSKEKQLNELFQVDESKEKQLNKLSQSPDSKDKQNNAASNALETKQEQIDELSQELDLTEKKRNELSQDHVKDFEVKVEDTNVPREAIELNWNQVIQQKKVCSDKMEENQVNGTAQNSELGKKQLQTDRNLIVNGNGNQGGGSTFRAMDGKTLQLYLNERVDKHGSMKGEVGKLLRSTSNPGKLVLDAIEGFFAPHMSKDGVAFEASVVRSSCLLLLEHLMNMKPAVSKPLKKEATRVSMKWRVDMKVQEENEVVALAFLLLLVTYNLSMSVKKSELRRLCELIDKHRLAPRLRQRLGLVKRTNVSKCTKNKGSIQSDVPQGASAPDSSSVRIPGDIHSLCRSMNEHGVRSYLLEHVNEYNTLHDKILDALRYAMDPAKLVLNVCKISLTDRDQNRAYVSNTTCIFLLKQLMKLSPSISHEVSNEAKSFATILKAKLKGSRIQVDHHRFLQFLVSYKLANSYDPDELLSHFRVFYDGEEVYLPEENTYLCFALGPDKEIPGYIKSCIDKHKLLLAVKYICVFKLEHTFPPGPLLEAHLESVKKRLDKKRNVGTFDAKIGAEQLEVAMLKNILRCISNFKIDSKLSLDSFVARINELEQERERRTSKRCERKRSASPRPLLETPVQQEKRPRLESVQSHPVDPVYWPPPRPHPFGPPNYDWPISNGPYPHFNPPGSGYGVVPFAAPGHFTHAGMYPVGDTTHSRW